MGGEGADRKLWVESRDAVTSTDYFGNQNNTRALWKTPLGLPLIIVKWIVIKHYKIPECFPVLLSILGAGVELGGQQRDPQLAFCHSKKTVG